MKVKGIDPAKPINVGSLKFRTGIYMLVSTTGAGKTTTCLRILSYINDSEGRNGAEMFYVGEPESNLTMNFEDIEKLTNNSGKIYIVDSVTLAMLEIASDSKGQVILKGGLLPSYIVTLAKLNIHCIQKEVCLILTMNETLFPVVDLSGATQGKISLASQRSILVSDRANRQGYRFNFPESTIKDVDEYMREVFGSSEVRKKGSAALAIM
jgi:energy-coupling factor transporter ATP-binding protein EcfA2